MSVTAIIQARMHSSRLPGKCLMDVAGVPLLKRVIDRVTEAKQVDLTVVATCTNGGEAIAGHCSEWDTPCVVSAKDHDVLGRFVEVCHQLQLRDDDLVVRVCGDNPLIRPDCIDELVERARQGGADYTGYWLPDRSPVIVRPTGYFAEVVKVKALRREDRVLRDDEPHREHVTRIMYLARTESVSVDEVPTPDWYIPGETPNTAIDTAEDLERVCELLREELSVWGD
jgi:spore coat polysaccharide biosynthesis protein SpsF